MSPSSASGARIRSPFAVGQAGTVLRTVDGGITWTRMSTPDNAVDLVGVWGTSASNVFAVGTFGTILRFNGQSRSVMSSPTGNVLLDVWGLGPDDIYAVGAGWRFDTTDGVAGADRPETAELWAVWGPDHSNIFAAGRTARCSGSKAPAGFRWRVRPPCSCWESGEPAQPTSMRSASRARWSSSTRWSLMPLPLRADLYGIWGTSAGNVLAVGNNGAMVLFNGSAWTLALQSVSAEHLRAVHASPRATSWWRDGAGRPFIGRAPAGESVPPTQPLRCGGGAGESGLRRGQCRAVYRESGSNWTPLPIPTRRTLYGASRQEGELLVVGDSGTILRYDGAQWKNESVPWSTLLRSVWTDTAGAAFVVGDREPCSGGRAPLDCPDADHHSLPPSRLWPRRLPCVRRGRQWNHTRLGRGRVA